jgi:hypothetical protein
MRLRVHRFAYLILFAVLSTLSSCASIVGARDIELPLPRLQQSIDKKFPFNSRYLELFDISVSNPRLSLQPDSNRIATALDLRIDPAFIKMPVEGQLIISGVLKIDASRSAVILTDPKLDNLSINTATSSQSDKIIKLANLVIEDLFNNMNIYTFSAEDLKVAGVTWRPTKIMTRTHSLVVSFEPEK